MAMILEVEYPGGERCLATGYPVAGTTLRVDIIPRGPEAAHGDVIECDFSGGQQPYRVLRVVAGPRRPTTAVRLPGFDEPRREAWMEAREQEGWSTRSDDADPETILVVAERDGLDAAMLERLGAVVLSSSRCRGR